jgi:hypothetical protein
MSILLQNPSLLKNPSLYKKLLKNPSLSSSAYLFFLECYQNYEKLRYFT